MSTSLAIEMGMKNHELVPTVLISKIAGFKSGPGIAYKIIKGLHRNKLVYHESKKCKLHIASRASHIVHVWPWSDERSMCSCSHVILLFTSMNDV